MSFELIIRLLSAIAAFVTILGAFVSATATSSTASAWARGIRARLPLRSVRKEPVAPDGVTLRLLEAHQVLRRQESLAKAHRFGGGLLTFGQFVVGGLLASSFMQQEIAKQMIGILGLLVLASSIIRQHYQPEIAAVAARERAVKLKAIIREVEDQMYYAEQNLPEARSPNELRRTLTEALNDVDAAEARALAAHATFVGKPKPPI